MNSIISSREFRDELASSLRVAAATMLVCCVIYGAAVFAIARVLAPSSADGSLVHLRDGSAVGSELIAQSFTSPGYFHSRPSSCGYNAAASGGSNISPTSPVLRASALQNLTQYGASMEQPIPLDLVTSSGSGLDPHITLAAARYQAARVAAARGYSVELVMRCVGASLELPLIAGTNDTLVHVLRTNMLLDGRGEGHVW